MTHYVAAFSTRKPDGSYLAVCGAAVHTYTTEPSCQDCRDWLDADAEMLDGLTRWSKLEDAKRAADLVRWRS